MQTYILIWTYIANYGKVVVQSTSAEQAAKDLARNFSPDFQAKGTIYVALAENVSTFRSSPSH